MQLDAELATRTALKGGAYNGAWVLATMEMTWHLNKELYMLNRFTHIRQLAGRFERCLA